MRLFCIFVCLIYTIHNYPLILLLHFCNVSHQSFHIMLPLPYFSDNDKNNNNNYYKHKIFIHLVTNENCSITFCSQVGSLGSEVMSTMEFSSQFRCFQITDSDTARRKSHFFLTKNVAPKILAINRE